MTRKYPNNNTFSSHFRDGGNILRTFEGTKAIEIITPDQQTFNLRASDIKDLQRAVQKAEQQRVEYIKQYDLKKAESYAQKHGVTIEDYAQRQLLPDYVVAHVPSASDFLERVTSREHFRNYVNSILERTNLSKQRSFQTAYKKQYIAGLQATFGDYSETKALIEKIQKMNINEFKIAVSSSGLSFKDWYMNQNLINQNDDAMEEIRSEEFNNLMEAFEMED